MSLVQITAVGICGSDLHWWDEGDRRREAHAPARTRPRGRGSDRRGAAGWPAGGDRPGDSVPDLPGLPGRLPEPVLPAQVLRPRRDRRHDARVHGLADDGAAPAARPGVGRGRRHAEPLGVAIHSVDLGHLPVRRHRLGDRLRADRAAAYRRRRRQRRPQSLAVEPLAHRREAAQRLGADKEADSAWFAGGGAVEDDLMRELHRGRGGCGVRGGGEQRGRGAGHGLGAARWPGGPGRRPGDDVIRLGLARAA